jgi:sugar phosphate permease
MGVAGLVLAPIFATLVGDRPRVTTTARAPASAVFAILARKPAFWLLAFASASSSLCGYGLALWTPSVLMRSFGFSIIETGQFLGSLILIGGVGGVFAGGWLADRLGSADRGWYARIPAIAWGITLPLFALGLMSPSPWLAWPLLLIPNGLNILWLGPVTTAVQHMVPREMRATASASFLLINNLIGIGIGPLLMGSISDALKSTYGMESLRYATVGCLGFYALASILALLAVKPLRNGWVADV